MTKLNVIVSQSVGTRLKYVNNAILKFLKQLLFKMF